LRITQSALSKVLDDREFSEEHKYKGYLDLAFSGIQMGLQLHLPASTFHPNQYLILQNKLNSHLLIQTWII